MENTLDYRYHIFGLLRGNRKHIETYVAEGASSRSPPFEADSLRFLAMNICHEHHNQIVHSGGDMSDLARRSLLFSFKPPVQKAFYHGNIYRTQKLSESEETKFLRHLKEFRKG